MDPEDSADLSLPAAAAGDRSAAPTVLLVDDDEDTRLIVRRLLERDHAFRVVGEAGDGLEGVARAGELRPDLVVIDLDMPGMAGGQVLPLIRAAVGSAGVVVFSDGVAGLAPRDWRRRGADMAVAKGADFTDLLPALRRLVRARGRRSRRGPRAPYS